MGTHSPDAFAKLAGEEEEEDMDPASQEATTRTPVGEEKINTADQAPQLITEQNSQEWLSVRAVTRHNIRGTRDITVMNRREHRHCGTGEGPPESRIDLANIRGR